MGAMRLRAGEFVVLISEAAGFKTGIALNGNQLAELFESESSAIEPFLLPEDQWFRIRAEDIDETFAQVLYKLGNINSPSTIPSWVRLLHKYQGNAELLAMYMAISKLFSEEIELMIDSASESENKAFDPTGFFRKAAALYGQDGLQMAFEIITGRAEDQHRNLSEFRRVEWENTIELEDLFSAESLEASYGKFLDQRYIDYLHRNQDRLGHMNWRKFEGLTAEFFDRQGYKVEIGAGRNDGGIDVRVWKENISPEDPPLILIQCKRYKEKIDKTVVKTLWADMQWEKASSGLIVTTSALSPGAKKDCVARGYNIHQADRFVISNWLDQLKTPGTGIFMGN
ncbi:restriction endonuclease [Undibacterium sp. SXout7W]|uniref:restriction endonuclease n=1 Tax=Undibacterium sp. SXout7W TaxID=3413049 RepID=UPI003BF2128C